MTRRVPVFDNAAVGDINDESYSDVIHEGDDELTVEINDVDDVALGDGDEEGDAEYGDPLNPNSRSNYMSRYGRRNIPIATRRPPTTAITGKPGTTVSRAAFSNARITSLVTRALLKSMPILAASKISLPYYGVKNGMILQAPFDHSRYKANGENAVSVINRTSQFVETPYQKTGVSTGAPLTVTVSNADLIAAGLTAHVNFMLGVTFGVSAFAAIPGAPVKIIISGVNTQGQSCPLGAWVVQRVSAIKPVEFYILPFRLVTSRPFLTDLIVDASSSLTVTVDTLPAGEQVTVTLPGQTHQFATDVRTSLGMAKL